MFELSPSALWLLLGLILIATEILTTSFILLFFGLAAVLVAGAAFLGLSSIPLQISLFALLGVCSLFLFRDRLRQSIQSGNDQDVDGLVGATLVSDTDIPSQGMATLSYRGAPWTAINSSVEPIHKGDNVRVEGLDGIKLLLKKL